jgi:hypothetical protein
MGHRDYPKRVDWRTPSPKCKWCGKSEVSFLWSGKKGQYCSFKCSAGGMYPRSVVLSFASSGLTVILFLIIAMMQGNNPHTAIPSFLWVVFAVPVILSGSFIYSAYIGRVLVKERQAGVE